MPSTSQIISPSQNANPVTPISGILDYSIAIFVVYSVSRELWQLFKKRDHDEAKLLQTLIDDLRTNNRQGFDKIVDAILSMKEGYRTNTRELESYLSQQIKEQTAIYSQQIGELNRVNLAIHTRIDELERSLQDKQ